MLAKVEKYLLEEFLREPIDKRSSEIQSIKLVDVSMKKHSTSSESEELDISTTTGIVEVHSSEIPFLAGTALATSKRSSVSVSSELKEMESSSVFYLIKETIFIRNDN